MAQPSTKGVPPRFASTVKGTIVKAGQMAKFEAQINGDATKPVEVHWAKDGKKVTADARHKMVVENNTYTLFITEPVPEDCGTYEIVAKNSYGSAQCQAQFLVQAAGKTTLSSEEAQKARPKIIEPMQALMIQKGQPAVFKCKISAKEPVHVKWLKGDKLIETSNHLKVTRIADTNTLRIYEVAPSDEGEYKCVVSNDCGSAEVRAPLKVLAR